VIAAAAPPPPSSISTGETSQSQQPTKTTAKQIPKKQETEVEVCTVAAQLGSNSKI
jgi:hypothetical protein